MADGDPGTASELQANHDDVSPIMICTTGEAQGQAAKPLEPGSSSVDNGADDPSKIVLEGRFTTITAVVLDERHRDIILNKANVSRIHKFLEEPSTRSGESIREVRAAAGGAYAAAAVAAAAASAARAKAAAATVAATAHHRLSGKSGGGLWAAAYHRYTVSPTEEAAVAGTAGAGAPGPPLSVFDGRRLYGSRAHRCYSSGMNGGSGDGGGGSNEDDPAESSFGGIEMAPELGKALGSCSRFGDGDGSYWDRWLTTASYGVQGGRQRPTQMPTKSSYSTGTVFPRSGFKRYRLDKLEVPELPANRIPTYKDFCAGRAEKWTAATVAIAATGTSNRGANGGADSALLNLGRPETLSSSDSDERNDDENGRDGGGGGDAGEDSGAEMLADMRPPKVSPLRSSRSGASGARTPTDGSHLGSTHSAEQQNAGNAAAATMTEGRKRLRRSPTIAIEDLAPPGFLDQKRHAWGGKEKCGVWGLPRQPGSALDIRPGSNGSGGGGSSRGRRRGSSSGGSDHYGGSRGNGGVGSGSLPESPNGGSGSRADGGSRRRRRRGAKEQLAEKAQLEALRISHNYFGQPGRESFYASYRELSRQRAHYVDAKEMGFGSFALPPPAGHPWPAHTDAISAATGDSEKENPISGNTAATAAASASPIPARQSLHGSTVAGDAVGAAAASQTTPPTARLSRTDAVQPRKLSSTAADKAAVDAVVVTARKRLTSGQSAPMLALRAGSAGRSGGGGGVGGASDEKEATDADCDELRDWQNSSRTRFLMGCVEAVLAPRASMMVRRLETTAVRLGHLGMGDRLGVVLARCLEDMPRMRELDLCDNRLTDRSLLPIVRGLSQRSDLTALDLSQNKLDGATSGELAEYFSGPGALLTTLVLSRADIDDVEAAMFVRALWPSNTLTSLDLSRNLIGAQESLNYVRPSFYTGAEAIADWLQSPGCRLTNLDLSWNTIRLDSAVTLGVALGKCSTLVRLDLGFNGLGCRGGEALAGALHTNSALTDLNIVSNGITPRAFFVLCQALLVNETLRSISMGGNLLGRVGARGVMQLPAELGDKKLRVDVRGSNFRAEDATCWFDDSALRPAYALQMERPYDRAIALHLLRRAAWDEGLKIVSTRHRLTVAGAVAADGGAYGGGGYGGGVSLGSGVSGGGFGRSIGIVGGGGSAGGDGGGGVRSGGRSTAGVLAPGEKEIVLKRSTEGGAVFCAVTVDPGTVFRRYEEAGSGRIQRARLGEALREALGLTPRSAAGNERRPFGLVRGSHDGGGGGGSGDGGTSSIRDSAVAAAAAAAAVAAWAKEGTNNAEAAEAAGAAEEDLGGKSTEAAETPVTGGAALTEPVTPDSTSGPSPLSLSTPATVGAAGSAQRAVGATAAASQASTSTATATPAATATGRPSATKPATVVAAMAAAASLPPASAIRDTAAATSALVALAMGYYDPHGTGTIEEAEFCEFVANRRKEAKRRDGKRKAFMALASEPGRRWVAPLAGLLTVSLEYQRLPHQGYAASSGHTDGLLALLAMLGEGRAAMMGHALEGMSLDTEQGARMYEGVMRDCAGDKVKALSQVLPRMSHSAEARLLVSTKLTSWDDKKRLRYELGPAYRPVMGLPMGHYSLDLSKATHRLAAQKVVEVANKERMLAGTAARPLDTSQSGDWSNIRNGRLNGKTFWLRGETLDRLPKAGLLEFDYVSTTRPAAASAMSHSRFVQMLSAVELLSPAEAAALLVAGAGAVADICASVPMIERGPAFTQHLHFLHTGETPPPPPPGAAPRSPTFMYQRRSSPSVPMMPPAAAAGAGAEANAALGSVGGIGAPGDSASEVEAALAVLSAAAMRGSADSATGGGGAGGGVNIGVAASPGGVDGTGSGGGARSTVRSGRALETSGGGASSFGGYSGVSSPQAGPSGSSAGGPRSFRVQRRGGPSSAGVAEDGQQPWEAPTATTPLPTAAVMAARLGLDKDSSGPPGPGWRAGPTATAAAALVDGAGRSNGGRRGGRSEGTTVGGGISKGATAAAAAAKDAAGKDGSAAAAAPQRPVDLSGTLMQLEEFLADRWFAGLQLTFLLYLLSRKFPSSEAEPSVAIAAANAATTAHPSLADALGELLAVAVPRIVDLHEFGDVIARLPEKQQAAMFYRVGWLNIFDPCRPDGFWELSLARREERQVAKLLIHLAVAEPGQNWAGTTGFRWGMFETPVGGWQLPKGWLSEDGIPNKGVLSVRYYSGNGSTTASCQPDWTLRAALAQTVVLCGAGDRIMRDHSLQDMPASAQYVNDLCAAAGLGFGYGEPPADFWERDGRDDSGGGGSGGDTGGDTGVGGGGSSASGVAGAERASAKAGD